jgi:hypothetical protein
MIKFFWYLFYINDSFGCWKFLVLSILTSMSLAN